MAAIREGGMCRVTDQKNQQRKSVHGKGKKKNPGHKMKVKEPL